MGGTERGRGGGGLVLRRAARLRVFLPALPTNENPFSSPLPLFLFFQ